MLSLTMRTGSILLGVGQANKCRSDDREQRPEDEYHHECPSTHRSAGRETKVEETESCCFNAALVPSGLLNYTERMRGSLTH